MTGLAAAGPVPVGLQQPKLAGRAATALENARAYIRERDMAVALRPAALPRSLPATSAGRLETSPPGAATGLNDLDADLAPATQDDREPGTSTSSTTRSWPTSPSRAPVHCPPVAAAPGATSQVLHGMHGPGLGRPHEKYYETRLPGRAGHCARTGRPLLARCGPGRGPTPTGVCRPSYGVRTPRERSPRTRGCPLPRRRSSPRRTGCPHCSRPPHPYPGRTATGRRRGGRTSPRTGMGPESPTAVGLSPQTACQADVEPLASRSSTA